MAYEGISRKCWEQYIKDNKMQQERERQEREERKRKWSCPEIKKKLNYDLDEIMRKTNPKAHCENTFADRIDRIIREQEDCHNYYLQTNIYVAGFQVDFVLSKADGSRMNRLIIEMDGSQHYWDGIDADIDRDFMILCERPEFKIYRVANKKFVFNWEYHTKRIIHWLNNWDDGPELPWEKKRYERVINHYVFSVPHDMYKQVGLTKHRVLNWPFYNWR